MCRFVAYVGDAVSPAPLVFGGEHSLYHQSWDPRELLSGSVNADGYGVVWYDEGRPRRIAHAGPIWHDNELENTLGSVSSTCVIAALRNATVGQPVDRAGLLPLVQDRFAFVLNGFVPDFHAGHMRALRAALSDDLYAMLRGSSDAETLFLMALSFVRAGAGLSEALEAVAQAVASCWPRSHWIGQRPGPRWTVTIASRSSRRVFPNPKRSSFEPVGYLASAGGSGKGRTALAQATAARPIWVIPRRLGSRGTRGPDLLPVGRTAF